MTKGRIAPSPTGFLHIGGFRTFLFNYWFIKKNKGEFVLRIDDTDTNRSKKEYEIALIEDLHDYGFKFDKIFNQSNRTEIYDKFFQILKEKNKIYEVFESEEDLETFRLMNNKKKLPPIFNRSKIFKKEGNPYYRFDLGQQSVEIDDLIKGNLKSNIVWSDPIVKTTNGNYTYLFASIIDDIVENITHIIRAEEHLANAFVQQIIAKSIDDNFNIKFLHIDILLDKDGSKLSKRNNSLSMRSLQRIEKTAILAYCFNLGNKNPIIDFYSLDTIDKWVDFFHISNYSFKKTRFDFDMLLNYNKKYLHNYNFTNPLHNILKYNVEYKEDLITLENKVNNFIENKKDMILLLKQHTIEEFLKIYNKEILQKEIFNMEKAPNVVDILNYIKNYRF